MHKQCDGGNDWWGWLFHKHAHFTIALLKNFTRTAAKCFLKSFALHDARVLTVCFLFLSHWTGTYQSNGSTVHETNTSYSTKTTSSKWKTEETTAAGKRNVCIMFVCLFSQSLFRHLFENARLFEQFCFVLKCNFSVEIVLKIMGIVCKFNHCNGPKSSTVLIKSISTIGSRWKLFFFLFFKFNLIAQCVTIFARRVLINATQNRDALLLWNIFLHYKLGKRFLFPNQLQNTRHILGWCLDLRNLFINSHHIFCIWHLIVWWTMNKEKRRMEENNAIQKLWNIDGKEKILDFDVAVLSNTMHTREQKNSH